MFLSAKSNLQTQVKTRGHKDNNNNDKKKLDKFLSHNNISFNLPGHNNQVYVGKGDDGKHQYKTQKFLLWTFWELVGLLKEEENDSLSSILFTTFDINLSQRIKWKKQNFTSKCTSCLSLDIEAINDCEEITYYTWEKGEKNYDKVLWSLVRKFTP